MEGLNLNLNKQNSKLLTEAEAEKEISLVKGSK